MTASFREEGRYELPRTVKLEGSSADVRATSAYQAVSLCIGCVDGSLALNEELSVFAAFACFDFDGELHDAIYCITVKRCCRTIFHACGACQ